MCFVDFLKALIEFQERSPSELSLVFECVVVLKLLLFFKKAFVFRNTCFFFEQYLLLKQLFSCRHNYIHSTSKDYRHFMPLYLYLGSQTIVILLFRNFLITLKKSGTKTWRPWLGSIVQSDLC